jgi:myotubularin-related protein 6/7/8
MTGITQNRSIQDEKLIEAIFQSHLNPESRASSGSVYGATTTNLIVDARPTANAMANTAKGAGSEIMDNYKDCKKVYLGIDNINIMRDSLGKVVDALREADSLIVGISSDLEQDMSGLPVLDRMALRRSGWLRHLRAILEGTLLMVKNVHVNSSHILVHCSDGWDRTAQLSSLAQICLDPYFRTIRGLQILVEKEWLSYGHKFNERCGHLSSESYFVAPTDLDGNGRAADALMSFVQNRFASHGHVKETSPVFHQFLECVWNIKRQFPTRFEYNDHFLHQLYYHLYSCQFGTFLYDCDRERRQKVDGKLLPTEATVSLWDFLNSPAEMEKSKNESYNTSLDDPLNREPNADMGVLLPNTLDIRFWYGLYGRTDEEMNGRVVKSQAKAPEVVSPISAGTEDPVVQTPLVQSSIPLPPSPSPSPALVQTPRSSTPPVTSPIARVPSPLVREDNPRSPSSSVSSFPVRPWSSSLSSGSPSKQRGGGSEYLSNAGVKSIWGKLSSNASAALSVVQDAYTNVSKDYLSQDPGSSSRTQEFQSRDATSVWGEESSGILISPRANPNRPGPSASHTSQTNNDGRTKMPYLPADNPWSSIKSPISSGSSPSLGSLFPDDPTVAHPSRSTASLPVQNHSAPQSSTTTTATTDVPTKLDRQPPNDDADPLGVWAS